MVNRLGILTIYDEQNVISRSDIFLAKEMLSIVNRLVICVNSDVEVEENVDFFFNNDHVEIIHRANVGYDGGAVKEVLCHYLGRNIVSKFDELVVCNNSFFGPFIPMKELFDKVDTINCEYWGLTGTSKGYTSFFGGAGSFFWGFRKSILLSDDFWDYINKFINSKADNFYEVCAFYENGINEFLMREHEIGIVYNLDNLNIFDAGDFAIIKYGLPIIKRKFFVEERTNKERIINILRYIDCQTIYDVELIEEKINRLYGISIKSDGGNFILPNIDVREYMSPQINTSYDELDGFITRNEEIYIYGTGHLASLVWGVFGRKTKKIKGFVVSKRTEDYFFGLPVIEISELVEGKSIIVALNKDHRSQVEDFLKKYNVIYLS